MGNAELVALLREARDYLERGDEYTYAEFCELHERIDNALKAVGVHDDTWLGDGI